MIHCLDATSETGGHLLVARDSMTDELLSTADGPVHRLVLDRPARRNALTPALCRAIADEIEAIGEAGDAHAIVLAGTGGHFSAGLDLHWLRSLGDTPSVTELQHGLGDFQSAVIAVVRCPIPVVAALRGTVAGFGLDLALACDLRVAGLVPDGGSTFTLPRLVGLGHAMRFLMAGETLDASRARAIGMVDDVVEDEALDGEIGRITGGLASAAPASLRTIKRLVRASELGALEQALSAEGAAQVQALQSTEFRRRLEAFARR
jgi:enoyl-CoA hydratase/carnithine racemase